MGPVFKRITMNYPPIMFHPINSITAYKGKIIYDTPETEAKAQTPLPYLQWQNAPGAAPSAPPANADLTALMVPPTPDALSTSHAGGPAAPVPAAPDAPPPAAPLPAEGAGG